MVPSQVKGQNMAHFVHYLIEFVMYVSFPFIGLVDKSTKFLRMNIMVFMMY
jgi:hypothetical protein